MITYEMECGDLRATAVGSTPNEAWKTLTLDPAVKLDAMVKFRVKSSRETKWHYQARRMLEKA